MPHYCCFRFLYSPFSKQTEDQVPTVDTTASGAECYLVNLVDPAFKIIVQVKYMLKIQD